MNKLTRSGGAITLSSIVVFTVFAMSMLLTLAFSAGVYNNIGNTLGENELNKTALAYISAKARSNGGASVIKAGEYHGSPAVIMIEDGHHGSYTTVLYWHEGWLCEIYGISGLDYAPGDGDRVVEMPGMLGAEQGPGGTVRVTAGRQPLYIYARNGRQG